MLKSSDWVTLTDSEQVVWSGGPSAVLVARELLAETLLVVVGIVVAGYGPGLFEGLGISFLEALPAGVRIVGLLLAVAGILLWLLTYLRFSSIEYLVTTDEVYVKRGLVSRSVTNLRIDRIQDCGFEQSALQRLLGYGDVYVSTAGSGGAELVFEDVSDPANVNSTITNQLDGASQRRRTA